MGPLTEAVTVYPAREYLAEPSDRGRMPSAASGAAVAVILKLAVLTKMGRKGFAALVVVRLKAGSCQSELVIGGWLLLEFALISGFLG